MTETEKQARFEAIAARYAAVQEKIREATARRRAGTGEVELLLATKTVPAEEIAYAIHALGIRAAGENRVQELLEKYEVLRQAPALHMIGSLQTNKVRQIVGKVDLIESVDSLRLAEEISRQSVKAGVESRILCEVNSGREAAKGGVFPEDVRDFVARVETLPGLRVAGLMTMGPVLADSGEIRKIFRETYEIFIDIWSKKPHNKEEPVLSMGMSGSFVEAVEEGATEVRVGSAVFGARTYPPRRASL